MSGEGEKLWKNKSFVECRKSAGIFSLWVIYDGEDATEVGEVLSGEEDAPSAESTPVKVK